MSSMTHRERILAALSCKPTDIVPFDLGGTNVTGLNIHACDNLKACLGMAGATEWSYYLGQLARMPEEMYRLIDGDVRYIYAPYPDPMPAELQASQQIDAFGVEWRRGATGLHYVSRSPLAAAESLSDLRNYAWPDPADIEPCEILVDQARKLRQRTDCAICLNSAASIVHTAQNLRGFQNWLTDAVADQRFFESLMSRVTEIYLATIEPLMSALGTSIDLILIADDFSGQRGPLMRPAIYRKMIKPFHARLLAEIRSHSSAKILFHSCGSVTWVVPDLLDIGIDGLNPVQVSAAHMNPATLKRDFGGQVCFWGGIDTQEVLPHGGPEQVRAAVRRMIDELGAGGGYVIAPVHNILPEVPPGNILAMADAAHVYGGRSDGSRFRQFHC